MKCAGNDFQIAGHVSSGQTLRVVHGFVKQDVQCSYADPCWRQTGEICATRGHGCGRPKIRPRSESIAGTVPRPPIATTRVRPAAGAIIQHRIHQYLCSQGDFRSIVGPAVQLRRPVHRQRWPRQRRSGSSPPSVHGPGVRGRWIRMPTPVSKVTTSTSSPSSPARRFGNILNVLTVSGVTSVRGRSIATQRNSG